MDIRLIPYVFPNEWAHYIDYFCRYLLEINYPTDSVLNDSYRTTILHLVNRSVNPFHIVKISFDGKTVGFIDYVCYTDEGGKCLIGNFWIEPKYRNRGIGGTVLELVADELKSFGGKYIDLTAEEKAKPLYSRHGFVQTDRRSLENGEIMWRRELK